MPLQEEDLEQITVYVREHLDEWVWEKRLGKPLEVYEIELRERTVRVEEELRHQRELMQEGFSRMDRRFEELREDMDRRFEQVDRRFEELREDMNRRFEQVDQRFEQVDRRFEELREDMNRRFEQVDQRFEQLTRRIDRFMIWSFGITVTAAGTVIAVLKVWP